LENAIQKRHLDGSPNQLTFGLGATCTFNMRPLW
jgi:hypothetical protein